MNILITGKSGFIGSPLFQRLENKGYCVKFLQWVDKITGAFQWVTETGEIYLGEFDPDVFIHLASESVSNQRWNKHKYKKIVDSRLSHAEKLVLSLKKSPKQSFLNKDNLFVLRVRESIMIQKK